MKLKKRILVTPMDWGLGHASRCIPLINFLLASEIEVFLASSGKAALFLSQVFPQLPLIPLQGYNIRYSSNNMYWNISYQTPKILKTIWNEHRQIHRIIERYGIHGIISDNRYGCFHKKIPSSIITHQTNIQLSPPIINKLVNRALHQFIHQFSECWIPDFPGSFSLSGELSQSNSLHHKTYIGVLSGMKFLKKTKEFDILVVLSGPEPQRTILEKKILNQLEGFQRLKILFIRGRPDIKEEKKIQNTITILPFLPTQDLNQAIAASDLIICRSGYSTIMDLAKTGKKALLIPTPGQSEQQYLAKYFEEKKVFKREDQSTLDLKIGSELARNYSGLNHEVYQENKLMRESLLAFINRL